MLYGITLRELARRVWHDIDHDDVFGQSAKLSYYFLLALFPLLILLTVLLGYFAHAGTALYASMLAYARPVLPPAAYALVINTLNEIHQHSGSGKLSIGLLGTVWAASNGVKAIMDALNQAYEVKEARPWWKAQIIAIELTIAFSFFIVIALAIVLYGNQLAVLIATQFGLGPLFNAIWKILQWPVVVIFVFIAFVLLYRFAPDLHRLRWKQTIPGAVIGLMLWILISVAFRVYLQYFNTYGGTYGSLGAVVILMLWLYLTGAAILIGGEVNSEIENAAAQAGAPEAHLAGEKTPGERRWRILPSWPR